jgi:hypothetical protein
MTDEEAGAEGLRSSAFVLGGSSSFTLGCTGVALESLASEEQRFIESQKTGRVQEPSCDANVLFSASRVNQR